MGASTGRNRWAWWGAALGLFMAAGLAGCAPGTGWTEVASRAEFQQLLGSTRQPVVAEFYMNGCPHCGVVAPRLTELADDYRGRALFLKVEESKAPDLAGQYGINGYPTVIFFTGGAERDRLVGEHWKSAYARTLDEVLARPPGR